MALRNVIDRAFELARTGAYAVAADVAPALAVEGYPEAELRRLRTVDVRRDLIRVCREAVD